MAERGVGDGRIARLFEAADALEAAIRNVGTAIDDEEVAALYEQGRTTIDGTDPLSRQAEVTIAALRGFLDVAFAELRGRQAVATRTCFKTVPPAGMYQISGSASTYWVCEHRPSHREP